MQQTQTCKLNLIDKNDVFSPDPLNDNARKLEAALTAESSARAAADTAETNARKAADTAETNARAAADAAEEAARKAADTAETNARISAVSALDQRLKTFEAHKLVTGTYTGAQGPDRTISVGFTPKLVFIADMSGGCVLMMEGFPSRRAIGTGYKTVAEIVTGGFQLLNLSPSTVNHLDSLNQSYSYLAYA